MHRAAEPAQPGQHVLQDGVGRNTARPLADKRLVDGLRGPDYGPAETEHPVAGFPIARFPRLHAHGLAARRQCGARIAGREAVIDGGLGFGQHVVAAVWIEPPAVDYSKNKRVRRMGHIRKRLTDLEVPGNLTKRRRTVYMSRFTLALARFTGGDRDDRRGL